MSQLLELAPLPLEENADGVIRVTGSRVPLDTLVFAYEQGATPEQIVQQYPSVPLADVYTVIGHYLRRRREVGEYLERRRRQAEQVRREVEARSDLSGIRERLLARRGQPV